MNDVLDKLVDVDAERAAVGSVLLAGREVKRVLDETLTAEMFSDGVCRATWEAVCSLTDDPLDIVATMHHMRQAGTLQLIPDGFSRILELAESVPTHHHARYYAGIVRDLYQRRQIIHALHRAAQAITDAHGDVWGEVAESAIVQQQECLRARTSNEIASGRKLVRDAMESKRDTLRTGIGWLDTSVGLSPGELVVVAGRPSMGKSSFAGQVAVNLGRYGTPVVIFSQEVSPNVWMLNSVARAATVDSWKLRRGHLSEGERAAVDKAAADMEKLPIHFARQSMRSVDHLVSEARRLVHSAGVQVVVVDYLQILPPGKSAGKLNSSEERVAAVINRLQEVARDMGVCVLAVSQLSRDQLQTHHGLKTRPPSLDRLRGSGAIEQAADVVIFLHRPEYYADDAGEYTGAAIALCEKHRNGPLSRRWFRWIPEWLEFRELCDDAQLACPW